MKWYIVLALSALIGCNGGGEDVVDLDGDGWSAPEDCDDSNAAVNPGAVEVCNGIDDDCDGDTDEDLTDSFFADLDGDGFGDPDAEVDACEAPADHVDNDEDCDDTDFFISPNAIEQCDDIDHNCDGNPRAGAIGGPFWGLDNDEDGFHNPDVVVRSCEQPEDHVLVELDTPEDCDDTDPDVNPDATELCDGVDNDCDGFVDVGAADASEAFVDADGDGFGDPAVTAMVCQPGDSFDADGDGVPDTATAPADALPDCDDADDDVFPGAPEFCNGVDDDCDPTTLEDEVAVDTLTWWRDADLDLVGDPNDTVPACEQPAGYVSPAFGEDCDDTDPGISPFEPEVCDGIDNDCSGVADDNAVDADTYWVDSDEDGWGDPDSDPAVSCDDLPGRVANARDCNDENADVGEPDVYYLDEDQDGFGTPLVSEASCNALDGYVLDDQDCDDSDATLNPLTFWYVDADGDGFGVEDVATAIQTCVPPGGYARAIGDCDDTDEDINPGVQDAPPINGVDDNCDGVVDEGAMIEHCGPITEDEVWSSDAIHRVTCTINVAGPGEPHLVIQPGAQVLFDADARLNVGVTGIGSMAADGVEFRHLVPGAGERWAGVRFGTQLSTATPSLIHNSSIRDVSGPAITVLGGTVSLDGIDIQGTNGTGLRLEGNAQVALQNSVLNDNVGHGVFAASPNARLTAFESNVISGNSERPVTISAASLGQLDMASTYTGNGDDRVTLLTGTVATDTTWLGGLGVTYRVDGTMTVGGGSAPSLFVEDGVFVEFTAGSSLGIATNNQPGSIEVDGTYFEDPTETDELLRHVYGVVFTSEDGLSGGWSGLQLGTRVRASELRGLSVENGGGVGQGAIRIRGDLNDDPDDRALIMLTDVRATRSAGAGVDADDVRLQVLRLRAVDNQTRGIEMAGNIVETQSRLQDSVIIDNAAAGVRVHPKLVELLDDGNTFAGNSLPLQITAGVVVDDATWVPLDEDYYVSGNVQIHDVDAPILTIAEGTTVYFGPDGELRAGEVDQGSLRVDGTSVAPVTLTSLSQFVTGTSVRGYWEGITLGPNQRQSRFRHMLLDYAGQTNGRAALTIQGRGLNPVLVESSTIARSGADGIRATGSAAARSWLQVFDSSIIQSNNHAVVLVNGEFTTLGSLGNPAFGGNQITDNDLQAMQLQPAGEASKIDTSNVFANNALAVGSLDAIRVSGGVLTSSQTWFDHGIPYFVFGGNLEVRNGAVLTIQPGTELQFDAAHPNGLELIVGGNGFTGGLVALGTSAQPIVFRSSSVTPSAGDWVGLALGERCMTATGNCVLDHVFVDHAGGGLRQNGAGIEVTIRNETQADPVSIQNTSVRYSAKSGLAYVYRNSAAAEPPLLEAPVEVVTGIVDDGGVSNLCFDSTAGFFGASNTFCENAGPNVLAFEDAVGGALEVCTNAAEDPATCP